MTAPIAKKKDTNLVTMKDVIFMYTSVSKPQEQQNTENKPPLTDHPLEMHSYEVKILISETRFKHLKKEFKGAKNLPNAKEYEKEELLEKWGDYLKEDDLEDDMYLVKFTQSALVGKPSNRRESFPIQQIGIKGRVQDIKGETVSQETNIANGTKGHFQFKPVETKFGLYLYPHLLCITDLIEYTGGTAEEDYDSLGLEELDESELAKVAEVEEVEEEENKVENVPF